MKSIFLLLLTLVVILGFLFWFVRSRHLTENTVTIGPNQFRVEVADTLPKQIQGLSGRASLCPNCGMLFVYSNPRIQNFWMRGMKFPLDIIFIRDHQIVDIAPDLPSPLGGTPIVSVHSKDVADTVLELNAGSVQRYGLVTGQPVKF
jgi:uncharacterized membrane protein (UPF0127 family)